MSSSNMFYRSLHEMPTDEVGSKAIRLGQLEKIGVNVPKFIVVPVSICSQIHTSKISADEFEKFLFMELAEYIPAHYYAVRSAALSEDGDHIAQAGVFKSIVQVTTPNIYLAIKNILTDAYEKSVKTMSIIIQPYIQAEQAGVVFTRNPLRGPELIIESVFGAGSKAVGGQAVTRHVVAGSNDMLTLKPWQQELVTTAQRVELEFNFPQDIEWVYSSGKVYIVQARPITTITQQSFNAYTLITHKFKSPYYLSIANQTEAFINPSPLMFSLLQGLYSKNGAIDRAYLHANINYRDTNQFILLGNKLFIDKEAELKSLYPAYTYFKNFNGTPEIHTIGGFYTSLKNSIRHQQLGSKKVQALLETNILQRLVSPFILPKTIEDMLEVIHKEYTLIYLINLHTAGILQKIKQLCPREYESLIVSLVPSQPYTKIFSNLKITDVTLGSTKGNSLSIDDTSLFYVPEECIERDTVQTDITNISVYKRSTLEFYCTVASKYITLRELARWQSVRLRNYIENSIVNFFSPYSIDDLLYCTLEDLKQGRVSLETIESAKDKCLQEKNIEYPNQFSSHASLLNIYGGANVCLSKGIAQGTLVTLETLPKNLIEPVVLYVDSIPPSLAPLLSRVSGIITKQGGLLSHLAIVAREGNIPVMQTQEPLTHLLNTFITLDSETGIISK